MNIGIYLYDQAEVLDFSGPFEVFSTANRLCLPESPFNVVLIGETGEEIKARGGYRVVPNHGFHDHPDLDILIASGGDHRDEIKKQDVLGWIARQAETVSWTASVCTGAFLLGEAGVLTHHHVTTHWEDIEDMRARYPDLTVHESTRWVQDGTLITSGGISAGIDMSLQLVSVLYGHDLAEKTARQMEFDWRQEGITTSHS